jgi:hypothetical protein
MDLKGTYAPGGIALQVIGEGKPPLDDKVVVFKEE